MSDQTCSECGERLIRCRIPGGVTWGWHCPVHGIVEPQKARPKSAAKASKKTEANEA